MSEQFRNEHEHDLYLACATGLYEVVPCSDSREIDEQAWQAVLAYRARCQLMKALQDGRPTMRAVPWTQASERMEAQRESGPADSGKEV